MMLRESSQAQNQDVDLSAVMQGTDATSGIPGETELLNLVEETMRRPSSECLSQCRDDVIRELGTEALVDAAAVVGNFQRMTRIADGTGIPLGDMMSSLTVDIRRELRLDQLSAAHLTKEPSWIKRLMIRALFPVIQRKMAKQAREQTNS